MQRASAVLSLATILAVAACDDGGPIERGFGSRQLVSVRDQQLGFVGWWNGSWLFMDGSQFWSLDLETGAAQGIGTKLPEIVFPPAPPSRYRCEHSGTGPYTATITDTQTGEQTVIDRVLPFLPCPTERDPTILFFRDEGDDTLTLWSGPYTTTAQVQLDLSIRKQLYRVVDGDATALWVFGARPAEPASTGVFAIALPDFAVSVVVPPALGTAAWATGATPEGPLESTSLSDLRRLFFARGRHYLYERRMSDGGATMFVGPYSSGASELGLFRRAPGAELTQLYESSSSGWLNHPVWHTNNPADASTSLVAWDDRRQQLTTCPSPFSGLPVVRASRDQEWLAVFVKIDPHVDDVARQGGPLLMIGPGSCNTLATADVTAFAFSPDASASAWLVQPELGDATLWTAGADGSAPRVIGTGAVAGPPNEPRFVGPAELQLQLDGDIAWVDVHDDPVRMHYIAERVFGTPIQVEDWLVTGYDRSGQDASGTLGVVNRRTGNKQRISPNVVDFASVGNLPPAAGTLVTEVPSTTADTIRIVYIVRGRNPSPQDGIWIATIALGDLR